MKGLRRLTRVQWAVVLAVTVLVAAGITVAALSLGGPSRPAVKLQVTTPSPPPSGSMTPATSGPAAPATPATPTVITPPPRAYTVSPPPPTTPAHVASPSPSPPGAVEVAKCPLNVKCTLP
ncbi:MAG TPA: hypothetical protein VG779_01410 [Actinomycetota bacterium]|jgi:hypothetical protein|nr:hypothetical protein [Actinomycetota bacterium]